MPYYSVVYEEYQKGYLLGTFYYKLHSLELLKSILDDFSENNYVLSDKVFKIEEKFQFVKSYSLLSHKKNIISDKKYNVLFNLELKNSFLYHIETESECFDIEEIPRQNNETVQFISRNLDEEIDINLN